MIKQVIYIKDYQLQVIFKDGVIKNIDLCNFISKSTHPLIRKYLDKNLFKNFHLDYGTICWGDNDFDINPQNIYKGLYDINKKKSFKRPNKITLLAIKEAETKNLKKYKNIHSLLNDLKK